MPQEGYADPVTNDGLGFHSITPVSELTELVFEPERSGQATKLRPSGCEEPDGVMHTNSHRPPRRPNRVRELKINALGPRLLNSRNGFRWLHCAPIKPRTTTPKLV